MISYEQYFYAGGVIFLSFLSTALMVSLIITKANNKKLEHRLSNREEIANESYLKFLTTSRNEAFTYIVDVQDALERFKNKIEPQLNYYNTYGSAVQGIHQVLVKELNEAYEILKPILPEENKEK